MTTSDSRPIRRRTLLAGGISAGLASIFLRPLEVAAANGPPVRFLLIHRPCGVILDRWFPPAGGTTTNFQLGPSAMPLAPLLSDMVLFGNVTAPRDGGWQGDRHGQGLITMVTGSRAITDGTPLNSDDQFHNLTGASPSIDQLLLSKSAGLRGSPIGSVHLGAYRDSVQGGRLFPAGGAPNFRVVAFAGANMPIFPEVRPAVAVQNLFGSAMPGGAAAIARQQQLNKSILDLVAKDLTALQKRVPSSQRPKLDSHLGAIQQLESQIAALGAGTSTCTAPTVAPQLTMVPAGAPAGLRIDAVEHQLVASEQLKAIKVAFQCDLIRVATFTFGHGNSDVQFANILPNFGTMTGHHDISHMTDQASFDRLAQIDTWYCQQVANFLLDLKNTPDGPGTSMLDNTLVAFISDVSVGNVHGWTQMPVAFFGGKSVGLQGGRNLDMKGQYMNDIWASTLHAFGVPLPADNKFAGYNVWNGATGPRLGQGAISGVFGP